MAGIGFELRRALRSRQTLKKSSGTFSAAFTCFGGMLIGIILLTLIQIAGKNNNITPEVRDLFMSYVTGTIFLSMLVTSVLNMVLSRYVSDMLFEDNYGAVMPSAIGGAVCSALGGGAVFLAFLACSSLPLAEAGLLFVLFEALCFCWILMNYISVLRDYQQITRAFMLALLIAGGLTALAGLTRSMSLRKMIAILIAAYMVVDAMMFRALYRGFPQTEGPLFRFTAWMKQYPALIAVSLMTEIGLLGHFWVTWYASRDGVILQGLFACCPTYDFPAIVAYFCTIPAMIYFIALFEPGFCEKYHAYIDALGNGGNAGTVLHARGEMTASVRQGLRNYASLQIISCLLFITVAGKVLRVLNIGMTERMLQTYQMFCVGYSFYSIGNILMLLQMYFANEKKAALPAALFALVTLTLTYIGGQTGGHATGTGLCVSALVYLIVAAFQLVRCLDKLEFHILCENPGAEAPAGKAERKTAAGDTPPVRLRRMVAAALAVSLLMIILPGLQIIREARRSALLFRFVPEKSNEVLLSPGMGYAPWANSDEAEEIQTTLVYVELRWADWEPEESEYDIDFVNEEYRLATYREQGRQVVFRFICDNPGDEDHIDIPDWLYEATGADGYHYHNSHGSGYSPNYSNEILIAAHEKAIAALGEAFGGDDFFCYVEIGSLGHWGEYHVNVSEGVPPLPSYDTRNRYIKPYLTAFPNARFMTRYPLVETVKYGFGLYNDMTGDPEETEYWLAQMSGGVWEQTGLPEQANTTETWKTQPIGGEFASSYKDSFYLHDNLSVTLEMLRKSHQSFIGPKIIVNETSVDYSSASRAILTTIGYRYYISGAEIDTSAEDEFMITVHAGNDGAAPIYGRYTVRVSLWDDEDSVVWSAELPEIRLDQLLPGEIQNAVATGSRDELDDDMVYTLTAAILNERGETAIPMALQHDRGNHEYELGRFRIR